MAIRTKLSIALTIATVSVLSIASSASAQTNVNPGGLNQDVEADHAAAAILLNTDGSGNVDVSAAASFGRGGASAIALPEFASAVSGRENGGILINDYYGIAPVENEEGAEFSGVVGFFTSETVGELIGGLGLGGLPIGLLED